MIQPKPTSDEPASSEAMTNLIIRIFRANGGLLQAGDRLVEPLGLTSARWQILGAVAAAEQPQPVVALARAMGVSRQAVQRIANDLAKSGLVAFSVNPRHKRAQLVEFTDRGRSLFEQAMQLHEPWVTDLVSRFTAAQVDGASRLLDAIVDRLDPDQDRAHTP